MKKSAIYTSITGLASTGVLLSTLIAAGPAAAANSAEEHCWEEKDTGRALCASSEDALAAKMFSTYGITLEERPGENLPTSITAPGDRAVSIAENSMKSKAAAVTAVSSTYLLTKIYDAKNYEGSTKTFTVSRQSVPCSSIASYPYGQEERLWVYGWNDRIRSFQTAGKCRLALYQNEVFGGTKWGPKGSSKSVGIMDREASSFSIQS